MGLIITSGLGDATADRLAEIQAEADAALIALDKSILPPSGELTPVVMETLWGETLEMFRKAGALPYVRFGEMSTKKEWNEGSIKHDLQKYWKEKPNDRHNTYVDPQGDEWPMISYYAVKEIARKGSGKDDKLLRRYYDVKKVKAKGLFKKIVKKVGKVVSAPVNVVGKIVEAPLKLVSAVIKQPAVQAAVAATVPGGPAIVAAYRAATAPDVPMATQQQQIQQIAQMPEVQTAVGGLEGEVRSIAARFGGDPNADINDVMAFLGKLKQSGTIRAGSQEDQTITAYAGLNTIKQVGATLGESSFNGKTIAIGAGILGVLWFMTRRK